MPPDHAILNAPPEQTELAVNILLVDDNVDNLLALEAVLAGPGRNIVKVTSGEEALKFLLQDEAGLILLDIKLEGMDGYEAATLIRERAKYRDVPIIFLTAYHHGERDVAKGYMSGAVDYLCKPFDFDILTAKVSCFVELARRSAALQRKNAELAHAEAELLRTKAKARENEARLRQQNQVLVDLAKSTIAESPDLWFALNRITKEASQVLNVERVSVWHFTDDRSSIRCSNLYEQSRHRHTHGSELTVSEHLAYFEALEQERTIAAHDARTDIRTAHFLNDYLAPCGITSTLDAPIRLDGKLIGVVCFEHVGPARNWLSEEQHFAGSIADIVALAMEALDRKARVQAYEKLLDELERSRVELQDKIRDLEKFEELTVGRELKMIQLEHQIEILKQTGGGSRRG
jgi:DNA-binding response OmpR family regulator